MITKEQNQKIKEKIAELIELQSCCQHEMEFGSAEEISIASTEAADARDNLDDFLDSLTEK